MLHKIYEKIESFDYEEYFAQLLKTLHHLSLFSVCLHFLTCYRSCDRIGRYCRYCSRVRANNFNLFDEFFDIVDDSKYELYRDNFLYLKNKLIDLDVFLERPAYVNYPHFPLKNNKCEYFQQLNHAQDLLVWFTSVLMRLYVNIVIKHFSGFISNLSLRDEKFVIEQIFKYATDLMFDFFRTNYLFFYEFINLFDNVNLSCCYGISQSKQKFGPYIAPLEVLQLEVISL